MNATTISREEARDLARERLPEVLADVVPGFRPERAFHCLNPGHEDRHPSMRYLSRSNTVKCFSCGWHGDVFDVVGVVHGLAGGDAFAKTYALLGIDARGGHVRRASSPPPPQKHSPGTIADLLLVIFPPGWDDPEPEVQLPEALKVGATAEANLVGILAKHPGDVRICWNQGLEGRHFSDIEIGGFYDNIRDGIPVSCSGLDFFEWLKQQAAPRHMLRKLVAFIIGEWQRRQLEATVAVQYSHFANGTPVVDVFEAILDEAELVMDDRFFIPVGEETILHERLIELFERFHACDDVREIIAAYRFEVKAVTV